MDGALRLCRPWHGHRRAWSSADSSETEGILDSLIVLLRLEDRRCGTGIGGAHGK